MKRISIITILDNVNFGTYLQVLALGTVLKKRECEVQIVKYVRPFMALSHKLKDASKRGSPIAFLSALRIYFLQKKYYSFLEKYFSLTPQYTSYSELEKFPPDADIYLTGSDQVWNSIYNQGLDRSYYLGFAPSGKKRVAYGASIGMESFPPEEVPEIKRLLSLYTHISVRESHAKEMLTAIGCSSVHHVLDPTLLLNKDEWSSLVKNTFHKSDPYLLIYSVESFHEAKIISQVATKVAKERGLKIYGVTYPGAGFKMECCDKIVSFVTPDVFISLFMQADYLVVSSFHGTSFAINFNKEFVTIAPKRFNNRVISLLSILNLRDRYLSDEKAIADLRPINYEVVNRMLEEHRQDSINYINLIIK